MAEVKVGCLPTLTAHQASIFCIVQDRIAIAISQHPHVETGQDEAITLCGKAVVNIAIHMKPDIQVLRKT